jgi:uncharacterized protein (TIGR03437 family)
VVASPGIFKLASTPSNNQAAVLNQDLSVNGVGNPMAVGDVAVIFATGGGQLATVPPDGTLPTFLDNITGVSVTIGGQPAQILYGGLAPYLAGVIQINATVPAGITTGPAVPIVLSIGGVDSSVETATIAVN